MNYPDYVLDTFHHNLNKAEFANYSSDKKRAYLYQEPHQLLLQNYISKPTMYENVLLYHSLGVGKTCAAITIAEGFKEYVTNLGRKIVVLVKNQNIQRNFMNEIVGRCTHEAYLSQEQRSMYFGVHLSKTPGIQKHRKDLVNKVHRTINKTYEFITYGTFVNQVLGIKEYEKDEYGRNTNKVKRVQGKIQRKNGKNMLRDLSNSVVIVDEAHNITNNDIYTALYTILARSYNYRLVLLTATPVYDNPKEIFELSNLLNVHDVSKQLPIRNELLKPSIEAEEPFVTKKVSPVLNNKVLKGGIIHVTDQGTTALTKTLFGKVSYVQSNTETTPRTNHMGTTLLTDRVGTTKIVECEMSDYQYLTYIQALKQDIGKDTRYDISSTIQNIESEENMLEASSKPSRTGSLYKNSSDACTMSYPNNEFGKIGFEHVFTKTNKGEWQLTDPSIMTTQLPMYSAKLHQLLQHVLASPGNVFIYSNYVSFGGTTLLKQLFLHNGFVEYKGGQGNTGQPTFVMYDESTGYETRERYRRLFNSRNNAQGNIIKMLIGSPIISEGITLRNVRQIHILEPSWNMSRVNQIIGRGVRNGSHNDLPYPQRKVDIYKYASVYPISKLGTNIDTTSIAGFFIDKEKYILCEEKDRANKVIERLLKTISFDCTLNKQRNDLALSKFKAGSSECDYQSCTFDCTIRLDTGNAAQLDLSTYNQYINTFDKFDVYYVINTMRNLFGIHFVWSLQDIVKFVHSQEPNITIQAIYTAIAHVVSNKVLFTDAYKRDGFIINRGNYYIFNPNDIDITSSMYAKMLDFEVDTTKYTLDQFVSAKFGKQIQPAKQKPKQKERVILSDEDIAYNNTIIDQFDVFGTYRQRGTKDQPFGVADNTFRIVDLRANKQKDDPDNRKMISGMWIGSYKKRDLISIANYLGVTIHGIDIEKADKNAIAASIEQYLTAVNRVLR